MSKDRLASGGNRNYLQWTEECVGDEDRLERFDYAGERGRAIKSDFFNTMGEIYASLHIAMEETG